MKRYKIGDTGIAIEHQFIEQWFTLNKEWRQIPDMYYKCVRVGKNGIIFTENDYVWPSSWEEFYYCYRLFNFNSISDVLILSVDFDIRVSSEYAFNRIIKRNF